MMAFTAATAEVIKGAQEEAHEGTTQILMEEEEFSTDCKTLS